MMWKSSPIPTICSGIHCIEPSFCSINAFQPMSKYDVTVLRTSTLNIDIESWSDLERLDEKWWKNLIISDDQAETCLIITINDTSRWEKLKKNPHLSMKTCTVFNPLFLCKNDKLSSWMIFHCNPSSSLKLCQIPSTTYHSVVGNVTYKIIPSILFLHPSLRSNTSLPPTLFRPSCRFKICVLLVKMTFSRSQFRHWHGKQKLNLSSFRGTNMPCVTRPTNVLLCLVLIFCTGLNLVSYTFCTGNLGSFSF